MLTAEDGKYLVELARKAISIYLKNGEVIQIPSDADPKLKEQMGVFVTLNKSGELRGCIGYPEPIMPLLNALIDASISAATRDPRFNSVTSGELDEIHFEVSVLTKPKIIEVDDPSEYIENIKIGQDGLIVEMGSYKGLLLPQVATEWEWDAEEFLSNTCMKAGLSPECWHSGETKIYRFGSQIFEE